MKKYNSLLSNIAERYDIKKGNSESDEKWKSRIIYSICGLMAYSSLWDEIDEEAISIVHMKNRIRTILDDYQCIYPEVKNLFLTNSKNLEDEITDIFKNCGIVYHCPHRIIPSLRKEASFCNISFQRGFPIDDIVNISGLGMYSDINSEGSSLQLKKMFGLEERTLHDVWSAIVSKAEWQQIFKFDTTTEYLRLKPPFTKGYWVNKADTDGVISLLRTGIKGIQNYFLYREINEKYEVSPLPYWQVEEYNYRTIASACLSEYKVLPPIEFNNDGEIINIQLNYLLPPRELNFLKLYSWPDSCNTLPSNFKMKCTTKVFYAIKHVLQDEGYEFSER